MEKLRLVRPEKKHEKQAADFLKEIKTYDSEFHGVGGLECYEGNYGGWLKKLAADRVQVLSEERVPEETFFLMKRLSRTSHILQEDIEQLVGMLNIRLALNDQLWQEDGNIGYSIRPSERRKGYCKVGLFLSLKVCQNHGIEVAFLDCADYNFGSSKTIRALGGRLARKRSSPHYTIPDQFVTVNYYVIDVDAALEKYASQYDQFVSEYPAD